MPSNRSQLRVAVIVGVLALASAASLAQPDACASMSGSGQYGECTQAGCLFDVPTKVCSADGSSGPASTTIAMAMMEDADHELEMMLFGEDQAAEFGTEPAEYRHSQPKSPKAPKGWCC